jgi:hypothetical protein
LTPMDRFNKSKIKQLVISFKLIPLQNKIHTEELRQSDVFFAIKQAETLRVKESQDLFMVLS